MIIHLFILSSAVQMYEFSFIHFHMFSYVGTVSQVVPATVWQVVWRHMRTRLYFSDIITSRISSHLMFYFKQDFVSFASFLLDSLLRSILVHIPSVARFANNRTYLFRLFSVILTLPFTDFALY